MKRINELGATVTRLLPIGLVVLLCWPGPGMARDALRTQVDATVHVDGWRMQADDQARFGSALVRDVDAISLRRAYVSLAAGLRRWQARVEAGVAQDNPGSGFGFLLRDAYIGLDLPLGQLQLGQRRPGRGLAELTDDNHILMIERPFASAAGVFAGGQQRRFTPGLYYRGHADRLSWSVGGYRLRALDDDGIDGAGASGRLTLAVLARPGEVMHLGLSASWEEPEEEPDADNPGRIGTAVAYVGDRGPRAVVGLGGIGASVVTLGLEYALALGPFFAQTEVFSQRLRDAERGDEDVLAYYLQAAVALTGESRPYRASRGVFGGLRPHRRAGAWEMTLRYDGADNRDVGARGDGCEGGPATNRCRVQGLSLGVNYYLNPGSRLMLNYTWAEQDRGPSGVDQPRSVAARLQFSL